MEFVTKPHPLEVNGNPSQPAWGPVGGRTKGCSWRFQGQQNMIWTWSYPWNKKMVRMAQHAIVPADNLLHPISAEIWSIRQPWKIDCLWYYSTPEVETITLFIGFHISLLTRSNALCYFQAIKSLFLKHSPFLSFVTLQLWEANK